MKANQRIRHIFADNGEMISGKISKTSKSKGKYKDCFHFQKNTDGHIKFVDLKSILINEK